MRRKPNYYQVRYQQYVIAGKIAVQTGAINPYDADGKIIDLYRTNNGGLHYSVIGQDFLRQFDINVTEL
jgi:hypothetical protein